MSNLQFDEEGKAIGFKLFLPIFPPRDFLEEPTGWNTRCGYKIDSTSSVGFFQESMTGGKRKINGVTFRPNKF
jgi:hypothetical protein